jgi:replicative DNA helicase
MKTAELITLDMFAREIIKRVLAEEDESQILKWISETITKFWGGDNKQIALMTWEESFEFVNSMVLEYEKKAALSDEDKKELDFPWASWNGLIDPLEAGILGVITAADGQGKTIYAESIAEHWAEHKNHIAFVHYELNRKLMMLRRTARHTSILVRLIKEGKLTSEEKLLISMANSRMSKWDGYINYIHTPGWTMDKTIGELYKLYTNAKLDAVVLDYVEKVAPSKRQLDMFGANQNQREADNVEQIKNFSETTGVPVLIVAQLNKQGKETSFDKIDRTGMRGAGEKSEKANLVVMLHREKEADGYSKTVNVLVDKNTMGATGVFDQIMQPEYYRVADVYDPMKG